MYIGQKRLVDRYNRKDSSGVFIGLNLETWWNILATTGDRCDFKSGQKTEMPQDELLFGWT